MTALAGVLLAGTGQAQTLIYQDNYDNDGLDVNTDVGGGMLNRSIVNCTWSDTGDLTVAMGGNQNSRRGFAYSETGFQSTDGFELAVTYYVANVAQSGITELSFGLLSSDDTDFDTYSGDNPFGGDTNVYSIGANVIAFNPVGLNFTDGSSVVTVDPTALPAQTNSVVIRVEADGLGGADCTMSTNGVSGTTYNIVSFDFSKVYHVTAWARDNNFDRSILSMSLIGLGNQPPIADPQSVTATVDTPLAVTLTGSDVDAGPGTLTYSVVDSPAHGTLSGTAPNLTYTPDSSYLGDDSFTFIANDGDKDSAVAATVSISVIREGMNISFADLSAALSNNTLTVDGTNLNVAVTAVTNGNDYVYSVTYTGADYDGDTVDDTLTFDVLVKAFSGGDINTDGSYATATIGTNVAVTTDAGGWSVGASARMNAGDTLQYTIQNLSVANSLGGTYSAALNNFTGTYLTEIGNANGHRTVIGEGIGLFSSIWSGNFEDLTGQLDEWNPLYISSAATPEGETPNAPQNWKIQNVDFDILVWADSIDQVPQTADLNGITTPETDLNLTLPARDLEGSTLNYTVVNPTHGTLGGSAPDLTYTPDTLYQGSDSFTFTVEAAGITSATGTVFLTVTNMAPVADDQSISTTPGAAVDFTLSGSDSDGPGTLTYIITSQPTKGTLVVTNAPNATYTPTSESYIGEDSFTFVVNDGWEDSAPATVSITISNLPPVAVPQTYSTPRNEPVDITLTATDTDGPSNLTYTVLSTPLVGSLDGEAPNLTYSPDLNYTGVQSFTFQVFDGQDYSDVATNTINIYNIPPVADTITAFTDPDTPVDILLTGSDPDDSGTLEFFVDAEPVHGVLSGTTPYLTYTPTNGFTGSDIFTYYASDQETNGAPATVLISVSGDGFALSFEDFDSALTNNTLSFAGSSQYMSVTGVTNDYSIIYSVIFNGADFDGDTAKDAITFDILVEAWADGTITNSAGTVDVQTTNGTAVIGTTVSNVTINAEGWAVGNAQMNEGQSLQFTLQNLNLELTDSAQSGTVEFSGFVSTLLNEIGKVYGHQTVIGEGTDLPEMRWNNPTATLDGFSTGSGPLYISQAAYTIVNNQAWQWQVQDVDFGIIVRLGEVVDPVVSIEVSGSDMIFSWEGSSAYNVLTNANLQYPSWGVAVPSATSPVSIPVGSESVLFYKLSE
jgi:hypothetical protein